MAQYAPSSTLLRVSKAPKRVTDAWLEGVHLETATGHSISDLRQRAAADRLRLAISFRRQGDRMLAISPAFYRDAVSRFYYAMYHGMRAVVFFVEGGDDHQEHKTLPGKTPSDFTNAALWQNKIKNARERRNAADYDPYPKADAAYKTDALALQTDARDLLALARIYLLSKGCAHL